MDANPKNPLFRPLSQPSCISPLFIFSTSLSPSLQLSRSLVSLIFVIFVADLVEIWDLIANLLQFEHFCCYLKILCCDFGILLRFFKLQ